MSKLNKVEESGMVSCRSPERSNVRAFLAAAMLFAAHVVSAAYAPAGTVTFANLQKIADSVASLAASPNDVVLTKTIPSAIRSQAAAKLFGPMRPGAPGVAVCYVDSAVAAKLAAGGKRDDAALERAKRWAVLYPATVSRQAFTARHRDAKYLPKTKTWEIPPGHHSHRTLYAWFSPDGQWAALGPSASIAAHVHSAAAAALKTPLGDNLAVVNMSAAGARVVFGADVDMCSGGAVAIKLTAAGLEVRGAVRNSIPRATLPPSALNFPGVPANAVEFGASSYADDIRSADVFAFAGPQMAAYVKRALSRVRAPNYSVYYLNGAKNSPAGAPPAQRLARILPEAKAVPASNVMFCSLTHVLKLYLPAASASMAPMDAVKMQLGMRLLRPARGDGTGFVAWRDGALERFMLRVSRDDLRGTANLWALMFN